MYLMPLPENEFVGVTVSMERSLSTILLKPVPLPTTYDVS